MNSAPLPPPNTPVEVWKDWLEENPGAVGMHDAPTFDREAAYLRWLEQSGTFERLGECMVLSLVAPEHRGSLPPPMNDIRARHWDWRRWVGGESPLKNPAGYAQLCAAFGVPAVFAQTGAPIDSGGSTWDYGTVWSPPSPQLATAVLKAAAEWTEHYSPDAMLKYFCDTANKLAYTDALVLAYRRAANTILPVAYEHHARASRIRLRLGTDGQWHERVLNRDDWTR